MKKKILTISLCLFACFSLAACGKDAFSKETEDKIKSIGEVTLDDESLIIECESDYADMTEDQKNQVSNYVDLRDARDKLDELKQAAQEELESHLSYQILGTWRYEYNGYNGKYSAELKFDEDSFTLDLYSDGSYVSTTEHKYYLDEESGDVYIIYDDGSQGSDPFITIQNFSGDSFYSIMDEAGEDNDGWCYRE